MTLIDLTIKDFIQQLAEDSPTPGGGSVAAMAGGLATALCAMVARLTIGRNKYREAWENMEQIRDSADSLAGRFLELVDLDTEAYSHVVTAFKLPKDTQDQAVARRKAIQEAYKKAALVPLETLRHLSVLLDLTDSVLEKGNPNCITDAGVAAQLIRAASLGAAYNVQINLLSIEEQDFLNKVENELNELVSHIAESVDRLIKNVQQRLC
jgi:formiminotetrahydrofolate cyclodeaminase